MAYDPNFAFQPVAPLNLAALMAARQRQPGLLSGVSPAQLSTLAKAMQDWYRKKQSGQIGFDDDLSGGAAYSGPQDLSGGGYGGG